VEEFSAPATGFSQGNVIYEDESLGKLTLVKYESNLEATFISLSATKRSPSYLSRIKSRPPRLRSGISAILTGVFTTASGI
jgi:hypothetical protein